MVIITAEQLDLFMSFFSGRAEGTNYIYDYRDKNIEFLEKLYKKRSKYYKKIRVTRLGGFK